nr:XPC-like protein isoform b [Drosophila melanogaster]
MLSKVKQLNAKHSDTENASPANKHLQEQRNTRETRSRSKSPKVLISPSFLKKKSDGADSTSDPQKHQMAPETKARISPNFLSEALPARQLRSRGQKASSLAIPQLDGGDDVPLPKKRPKLEKLKNSQDSDEVFEPAKPVKKAPVLPKSVQNLRKDRRVMSTDEEGGSRLNRKTDASDMWVEVWSDVEEQWICIDLFKGKLHCVDTIRKNATPGLAYVFAFQDDQSLKDVTARYCASWSTTVRKARVEKAWLDETIAPYLGRRTKRDITEDDQLRRIHSDKPLPKSISEFKDHPLYVLERHLLKFQGLYPPDAPTLGFIRGEAVYSRDCVHLLHSREIWLKSARVVKLGEQPYKVVKARPKWDRLTRTVIKDQPLEIFGYWQTQEYEPPTAENGIVPRNAYGNVELFKDCMLPKKTVHLRLPGLMRICKKLNIDCANAVVGFDFHQGACHPMYDGFIVCEEFREVVTAAWEEDQQVQVLKEQEKYETRVYGNWKKLIKGLLIRERLKKKYNF